MSDRLVATSRQGNYAGGVSRLAAFAADVGLAWASLLILMGMASMALSLASSHSVSLYHDWRIVTDVSVVVWFFAYFSYQWTLGGKTLGMAIFGLRVVTADGAPISGRAAVVRTLTLPLSIVPACLGLVGIILRVDHRAWHDRFARTCVVYDWDARAARLLWLARQQEHPGTRRHP